MIFFSFLTWNIARCYESPRLYWIILFFSLKFFSHFILPLWCMFSWNIFPFSFYYSNRTASGFLLCASVWLTVGCCWPKWNCCRWLFIVRASSSGDCRKFTQQQQQSSTVVWFSVAPCCCYDRHIQQSLHPLSVSPFSGTRRRRRRSRRVRRSLRGRGRRRILQ